jgi:hypothetical protein
MEPNTMQTSVTLFFFLLGVSVGVGLMFMGIVLARDERKNAQRPIYVDKVRV